MAYRWHLGEDQPGYPRTPEGSLEQRSSAQRWRGGFPISVKSTAVGGEERGYDGGKKIKGRKRHILVDTEGFVLRAKVHSAKVMDHEGIKTLLRQADTQFPRLRLICGWTQATVGRTRARTGSRRPWDGASISSSVRARLPPKRS
jgi:hypothetical protein